MSDQIAVVVLDINKEINTASFLRYKRLTAKEQIDVIFARIAALCVELKKTEPKSMWIIAWREYGICELHSQNVSLETKNYLLQKIRHAATQHPQLTIMGPQAVTRPLKEVEKNIPPAEKRAKLKTYFEHCDWIKAIEASGPADQQQTKQHFDQIDLNDDDESTEVVSITLYAQQGAGIKNDVVDETAKAPNALDIQSSEREVKTPTGDKKDDETIPPLMKHRKIAFFNQTAGIARPGSAKTASPLFFFTHPFSHQLILCSGEICRENTFSITKKYSPSQRPLIQFIFADSTFLQYKSNHADFVIPIDSVYTPRLISTQKNINPNVRLYVSNVLNPDELLTGPLQPVYPIELQIMDRLEEALTQSSRSAEYAAEFSTLTTMKNNFLRNIAGASNLPLQRDVLSRDIDGLTFQHRFFGAPKPAFFILDLWRDISKLINDHNTSPYAQEFNSKKSAPLLIKPESPEYKSPAP